MAKGQKKSNKEIRKPKADKSKAKGASPTLKDDTIMEQQSHDPSS